MRRPAPVVVLVATVAVLLLVGALLPLDAVGNHLGSRFARPSLAHPFGTDQLGRDVLARIAHGARLSVGFTLLAVTICAVVGTVVGMAAGFVGGVAAQVVQRLVDVLIAIPSLVLGLVLATILRPGVLTLLLAVVATGWTPFARLAAGLTTRERNAEYVEAALALGAGDRRIVFWHIFPNVVRPLLAHTCLRFANTLLAIAGLSFLGLGAQPPTPEWGAMINDARPYLFLRPELVIVPAVFVVGTALVVILFGRALERHWTGP